ncbi:hypothetical protein HK096_000205, partial [Nowakowskiella sp. JEL0078]
MLHLRLEGQQRQEKQKNLQKGLENYAAKVQAKGLNDLSGFDFKNKFGINGVLGSGVSIPSFPDGLNSPRKSIYADFRNGHVTPCKNTGLRSEMSVVMASPYGKPVKNILAVSPTNVQKSVVKTFPETIKSRKDLFEKAQFSKQVKISEKLSIVSSEIKECSVINQVSGNDTSRLILEVMADKLNSRPVVIREDHEITNDVSEGIEYSQQLKRITKNIEQEIIDQTEKSVVLSQEIDQGIPKVEKINLNHGSKSNEIVESIKNVIDDQIEKTEEILQNDLNKELISENTDNIFGQTTENHFNDQIVSSVETLQVEINDVISDEIEVSENLTNDIIM